MPKIINPVFLNVLNLLTGISAVAKEGKIISLFEQGVKFQAGKYVHPHKNYSVFLNPPPGFKTRFKASGCFLEYGKKILLLKRNAEKTEGNLWGIPGGKIEPNETPRAAVIREISEETGLDINKDGLREIGKHYIRLERADFIFYMFSLRLSERPKIRLALNEHQEARWVTTSQALKMPLITGEIESFLAYRQMKDD